MSAPKGKVYFIGAGPGDPELLTLKAAKIIARADLILYPGSLVPRSLLADVRADAEIADTASLTLEETSGMLIAGAKAGKTVVRLQAGDCSLYGTVQEQAEILQNNGIEYEIIPGVSSAFAAAALAGVSFTQPQAAQSLIFTRISGRTEVPESERLRDLAAHNTSMAIFLSAAYPEKVQRELLAGGMAEETPVVIAHKVGLKDEQIFYTDIRGMAETAGRHLPGKQTLFLVLPGLLKQKYASRLYDPDFKHGFRS